MKNKKLVIEYEDIPEAVVKDIDSLLIDILRKKKLVSKASLRTYLKISESTLDRHVRELSNIIKKDNVRLVNASNRLQTVYSLKERS